MTFLEARLPAPILAALIAATMWLIWRDVQLAPVWSEPRVAVAVLMSQISAALVVAAGISFWRARTTIDPMHPERAAMLVTTGIYRYTRNPMYLSLLLLLLAYALRIDALAAFSGPAFFAGYVTRFQIVPEERALRAKFSADYAHYCLHVRRWL